MAKIFITGGAGYIGSHTAVALLNEGFEICILDNLYNSSPLAVKRIEKITKKKVNFIKGDILDRNTIKRIFEENFFDGVIHFAGLKAVGESVANPLSYYETNVAGSLNLLSCMKDSGIRKIVFSSSATVYGNQEKMPLHEDMPLKEPTNPYGQTKFLVERILKDIAKSDDSWRIGILRYFNPVGSHESGLLGESPKGLPNNLLPYLSQVAIGRLSKLSIYGNDYPTIDGTGVRDYIHVMDIAEGHVKAVTALEQGVSIWNLGTGQGYSVLQILKAFEKACGRNIPYVISPRRPGDIAECWADPQKAQRQLNWEAKRNLSNMMDDTWRWQKNNPEGYQE